MAHIGLYDSGIGGLTVLKALIEKYPNHRYTYLGDNKYAPYGSKSASELWERNQYILDFLIDKDVDQIVIACNTSTALFLDKIKSYIRKKITVTSIIEPACQAAINKSKNNTIGVLATDQTIKSKIYSRTIKAIDSTKNVIEIPCPELVPLIEAGEINNPAHFDTLTRALKTTVTQGCDTIIYGCTHYPLLDTLWQSILKKNEVLINPANTVSIRNASIKKESPITIYCSGNRTLFEQMSTDYLTQTEITILSIQH